MLKKRNFLIPFLEHTSALTDSVPLIKLMLRITKFKTVFVLKIECIPWYSFTEINSLPQHNPLFLIWDSYLVSNMPDICYLYLYKYYVVDSQVVRTAPKTKHWAYFTGFPPDSMYLLRIGRVEFQAEGLVPPEKGVVQRPSITPWSSCVFTWGERRIHF